MENEETKIKMLKQFKSQQNKPYFQRDTIDGFHTDFDCSKKGMNKIEKFKNKGDKEVSISMDIKYDDKISNDNKEKYINTTNLWKYVE